MSFKEIFQKLFQKKTRPIQASSLSSLLNKDGQLPINEILSGKFRNLIVEHHPVGHKVSMYANKTGTKTSLVVNQDGRIHLKDVVIGGGNDMNQVMDSFRTTYEGTIRHGKPLMEATSTKINYTVPLFPEANGFRTTYAKNMKGWSVVNQTPLNI